ncbi:hypothetical protein KQX54_008567 [Cotesia glomerata]|uniref:Uncharacterized protein n=1 Tax=Cotesia glomerata TaxID=32391 RepID=A0AAV7J7V4_COTGL|nr:hypothetical protein KQX54_008567 [Cotesia glomerata]
MKFLIVIFCVIVAIYGHKQNMYSHGRCPEFLVIEDSNYVNFTGNWCICEQHAIGLPGFDRCITMSLEPKKSNIPGILLDITYSGVSENGQSVLVHGEALYKNSRDIRATYLVGETQVIKHYFINKLDNNYAMIGSCMEEGSYHIFEMWAVARDCLSCLNVQNGLQKEFEINRFSFNFTRVDHSNCP